MLEYEGTGNMTMEYGSYQGIWSGIFMVTTQPGNHALVLQKGRNLHCLFGRLNFSFYILQVFFQYSKAFIYPPQGRFWESYSKCCCYIARGKGNP